MMILDSGLRDMWERENFIRKNAGKTRKPNAHQCWCLW